VFLKVDCSKARAELGWKPRLRLDEALERVVEWHSQVANGVDPRSVSLAQLAKYEGWTEIPIGQAQAA
jgi:CDP-glucose 4,6-dehydratase